MSQEYLFLFTISPVKSFIAQSRKTQDLYAGSRLLSDLCREGAKHIKDYYNADIIFPYIDFTKVNQSLPNRFVIKVNEQEKKLEDIGFETETIVRTFFINEANKLLTEKSLKKPTGFDEQIEKHLEINWAFLPLDRDYEVVYQELESLIGSIKNTRLFSQFDNGNGEQGRKCSLDGERNALFFGRKKTAYSQSDAEILNDFMLEEREGLSAVSFLKRYYEKTTFDSIAHIALYDTLDELLPNEKKIVAEYENIFKDVNSFSKVCLKNSSEIKFDSKDFNYQFDEQFLFSENLTEKYIPNPQQLDCAKTFFLQQIPKSLKSERNKYYAILTFDGDNMGKWLSGAKTPTLKGATFEKFHKELSKLLGKFAQDAEDNVKAPEGKTVYAGGDDYLGFINLNYLFPVMQKLRKDFDDKVNQPLKIEFGHTEDFTFSAGVAIAHYKTPMSIVLKKAEIMQSVAKEKGYRNAFAISVLKKSGESNETYFKWNELEKVKLIIEELKDNFSTKFLRSLAKEFYLLMNDKGVVEEDLVASETERLLKRACLIEDKILKTQKTTLITNTIVAMQDKASTARVLETLYICDFIERNLNSN